jgi:peptidoglycan/LPS O-acetylase OafA/YrhL
VWTGALAAPLLLAGLSAPGFGPTGIIAPLIVYLLFPLIILGGAAREARFPRLCTFLGGISYPLYILHLPLIAAFGRLLAGLALPASTAILIKGAAALIVVWLAWRFYDEPVRAWLRRRFARR